MARMPHVTSQKQAKFEHTYEVFEQSGTYHIEGRISDVWFVINHRVGDKTDSASYVGVMIAKVLGNELSSTLELLRNKSWFSLQDESRLDKFHKLLPGDFPDFHNRSSASFDTMGDEFKSWHALARVEPKLSSWDLRREWRGYNTDCLRQISKDSNISPSKILVQAHLLRFIPTSSYEPRSPVVWKVALGDAKAAYIRIFSPISDFRREYYISLPLP